MLKEILDFRAEEDPEYKYGLPCEWIPYEKLKKEDLEKQMNDLLKEIVVMSTLSQE